MPKLTLSLLITLCCTVVFAQQYPNFPVPVPVKGKLYRLQDSTLIAGNIYYEKLPYYDDVGFAQAGDDGMFDMQLVENTTYKFKADKEGYISTELDIEVKKDEEVIIYLKEDIADLIKLDNLIFKAGSDVITAGSYQELDDVAKWMNDNPQIIIQLEGHTDTKGRAQANMALSQARVEAVKAYLVDKKVKSKRVLTKAFGGTQPLSTEDTPEAHALNRRVEVRVLQR